MMRVLGLVLALSAATPALGQQLAEPAPLQPGQTLLNITAEGESRRTPDIAVFNAGVVTQAQSAGDAIRANSQRMATVMQALRRTGVEERDIQTAALSLQPQYSTGERDREIALRSRTDPNYIPPPPEPPRIIGYEARNNVQVRVRNLARMSDVIDALIQAGANQVDGPSFTLDEPQAALDEARAMAMQRARQRADLYARNAGLRVSHIIAISEGGGYYPVPIAAVASRGAGGPPPPPAPPPPVSPGELALGVNLSVQFALVP